MVNFNEKVGIKLTSINDTSLAFGHKSALDQAGASYNSFAFTTSSLSYDTAAWSTEAHIITGFNTLLKDLEAKGIIIKT